jgi:hypothetical protein
MDIRGIGTTTCTEAQQCSQGGRPDVVKTPIGLMRDLNKV